MPFPEPPNKLVDDLHNRKCVAFVGAGIPREAGFPDWAGLLREMISWCERNDVPLQHKTDLATSIEKRDFQKVADALKDSLDVSHWHDCLTGIFSRPFSLTKTHQVLASLPFVAAVTTNYDRVLESAYSKARETSPRIVLYSNDRELMWLLGESEFYILKAHGTIDDVSTVVLDSVGYRNLIYSRHAYMHHLTHLLTTKTVFFVGFSLADPDLKQVMERLLEISKGHSRTHYALMDRSIVTDLDIEHWRKHYSIVILPYESPSADYSEVREFLECLNNRIEDSATDVSPGLEASRSGITDFDGPVRPHDVEDARAENANVQRRAVRQELSQLAEVTTRILTDTSEGITSDPAPTMEPWQLIRLHLLTTLWMSSRTPASDLDTHEANYLHLHREQIDLSANEMYFVLRMLVNDLSGYVPGWYWLRTTGWWFIWVLNLALYDPLTHIRKNGFDLLREAGISIDEFPDDLKAVLREPTRDRAVEVRTAHLRYLGGIGTAEELQALLGATLDEDSAVARDALHALYAVQLRINPSAACKQIFSDSRIEIKRLSSEIREYVREIPSAILVNALQHQDDETALMGVEELIRRNEFTTELAAAHKEHKSQKVREFSYRRLVEAGVRISVTDILTNVRDETYDRRLSRNSIIYRSVYADPYALVLEIYRSHSLEELYGLAEWKEPFGELAYKAIALYHFAKIADQVRVDLENGFERDFTAFLEAAKSEWAEREPIYRPESRRSGFFSDMLGPVTSREIISVDELARGDAERKRNEFTSAALAALAVNGERADLRWGRKYASNDDYDVRVEAINLVARFGDVSDAGALVEIAKHTEGVLQEEAARAALRFDPGASATSQQLLQTADAILLQTVLQSLLNVPHDQSINDLLEPLLSDERAPLRLCAIAYFIVRGSEEELKGLLNTYTTKQVYYYDVVCWLDRALYAPPSLQSAYKRQLRKDYFES